MEIIYRTQNIGTELRLRSKLSCNLIETNKDVTEGVNNNFFKKAPQIFKYGVSRMREQEQAVGCWSVLGVGSVQLLSHVPLFATPRTAAHQASLSITNSWSLLRLMSIELVMPSSHLILCRHLLLLPSIFPASGSFQMSQFFT